MGAGKAAEAQAYVRQLLAQKDPGYALILESALNDELIKRCQTLSAFVREVAEAGGMAPWDMAERAKKLLEEVATRGSMPQSTSHHPGRLPSQASGLIPSTPPMANTTLSRSSTPGRRIRMSTMQSASQPDMSGWSLDELRTYAERVSQADGTATVLVVLGQVHEYVVPTAALGRYQDPVTGALIEALRSRQEQGYG